MSGFTYKTEIYSGQKNKSRFRLPEEPDLNLCANVVVRLSKDIPKESPIVF